jgi:hypothetical protein
MRKVPTFKADPLLPNSTLQTYKRILKPQRKRRRKPVPLEPPVSPFSAFLRNLIKLVPRRAE